MRMQIKNVKGKWRRARALGTTFKNKTRRANELVKVKL